MNLRLRLEKHTRLTRGLIMPRKTTAKHCKDVELPQCRFRRHWCRYQRNSCKHRQWRATSRKNPQQIHDNSKARSRPPLEHKDRWGQRC